MIKMITTKPITTCGAIPNILIMAIINSTFYVALHTTLISSGIKSAFSDSSHSVISSLIASRCQLASIESTELNCYLPQYREGMGSGDLHAKVTDDIRVARFAR